MENQNINNAELPKEIKSDNENINPLLDIISSIQEKLDGVNKNSNIDNAVNNSNTYTSPNSNFNFTNNNMNMDFNSSNTTILRKGRTRRQRRWRRLNEEEDGASFAQL